MEKLCNSRVHATLIVGFSSIKGTRSRFSVIPAIVQEKILIQLKSAAARVGGIMVKLGGGGGGGKREFRLEGGSHRFAIESQLQSVTLCCDQS